MASPWPLGLVQHAYQDEGLSPLAAVVQGCRTATSALQRLAHVEAAKQAALDASYEECAELLLPLLEALLDDADGEVQLVTLRELRGIGELLRAKDPGRAFGDLRDLLPVVASLALADNEAIAAGAITTFGALVALLPQDAAAAESQSAIAQLEAVASEDAPVQAARLFAHSAAAWPPQLLASRAPELLRRWCGHRDFAVREAAACCMSLVGRALLPDAWSAALLPWLSQLVRDNNWRVRRAAALDLPRLAGKLHCWQQRCMSGDGSSSDGGGGAACCCAAKAAAGNDGEGGCFVCDATESCCGACSGDGGTIGAAAAWCRCSDGGVTQLPADLPFGGCAHLGRSETRAGRDDRHSRHHQGRRGRAAAAAENRLVSASLPASVWSVHAQRPASAALGLAGSMGKHPLSSSLLLDPPANPLGFPDPSPSPTASSSSLSSSDGANPLGDSLQATAQLDAGDGSGGVNDSDVFGPAEGAPKAGSTGQQEEHEQQEREQQQSEEQEKGKGNSACALAEADAVLHGCWASLRDCLDCATADGSHWVRVTALSGLGPCLLALPPCQISGDLLAKFAAMGSSSTVVYGISVALACAQSLGPVSSRLGPRRWPDLRPAFLSLQATREPAVLQELVTSLPLLARHLGEPALQLDILPALLTAAHDHLNWVDAAVVAAAPPLAEALPQAAGEPLLRLLSRVATAGAGDAENCRTWRLRRDVAERLGRLAHTARQEAIMDVLWPVAVTLCSDPVAAVRDAAAAQVGPLLSALLPLAAQEQQRATAAAAAVGSPGKALVGSCGADSIGDARQQDQGACHQGQGLAPDGQPLGSSLDKQQGLLLCPTNGPQVGCGGSGCASCENGGCASSGGSGEGSSSSSADCCTALGGAVTSDGDDEADSPPSAPPAYEFDDAPSCPSHFGCAPGATAAGAGGYGSSCGGSEGFDDDALFCVLPCALAAPPCNGLSATGCSALQPFADALPAAQPPAAADPVAASPAPTLDPEPQGPLPCSVPAALVAAPGTSGWASSESESDSDAESGGAATTPTPRALGLCTPPRSPLRPAAGAAAGGAARESALRFGSSMHPAMAPVGSWGAPPPPRATGAARHGRCASTGELSAAAIKTPPRGSVRRHASAGRLGGSASPSAGRLDPLAPRLSPSLYVDCLIQRFAQSPSWQGRQLFVTIGLGLLAAPPLPKRKQEMVVSALAALGADKVASVRIAAQAAAAALLAAAAEREGGRLQQTGAASGCGGSVYANGSSRRDSGSSDGNGAPVADCAQLPCPVAIASASGLPNGQQHLAAAAHVLAASHADRFEAAAAALCGTQTVHVRCTAPLPIDV